MSEMQDRLSQGKIAGDVIGMLRDAQGKLLEANSALLEDNKLLKQAQQDKDRLWEMELEDIQKALSGLKSSQGK